MRAQTRLLRSKNFLPLFITQFLGAFNDNAFKNSFLIWFTYAVAKEGGLDAPLMLNLAAGLFILPFFLFSATAGQFADKYERSQLTRKIKLVEIFLMIACAFCFFFQSVYGLLVILFLMGTQSTFFGPIKYSLLPEHLQEDELINGNALIEGGTFLSILLGTIFGGLIILTEHGVELLSLCVIGFAVVGWISSYNIPKAPVHDPDLRIGANIAADSWEIMGYASRERIVWFSIIGISWFWLIGTIFLTQFPIYTQEVIRGNEHIVTLFLALFSIGIGLGSILCNRLLKGEINAGLVPSALLGMSLAIILFVVASFFYQLDHMHYLESQLSGKDRLLGLSEFFAIGLSSWLIMFSLFALAVCSGVYIVPLYAIMQHRSKKYYLSRIIAANNVINALFMVFASIGALVLFALNWEVTEIVLLVGLLNLVVFFLARRVIKQGLDKV